jgi:CAAX protease family protein
MHTDAASGTNDPKRSGQDSKQSAFQTVFLNENGLRAGWRLMLYLAIALVFKFCADFAGSLFLDFSLGADSLANLWFEEVSDFAVVFGAALLMAKLERRPAAAFGLPLRGAFGGKFWLGMILGLCEICVLMGLIAVFGGYSFGPGILLGSGAALWAIFWIIFFVFVGLLEEFLFRGYTQFTLADGIGFWPAAMLLSLAFGGVHLRNHGENWLGVADVVITGLVFAFALWRTGNLWLAVGWHASFDFGETFLFSVPNSGGIFPGHLSRASLHGPAWLTGGTVGPEASVFAFLTLGLSALIIHFLYPAKRVQS